MNNLIVLLVAVIAFTNAEPLLGGILGNAGVLSGNDLGGTIGGIGGATDIIGDANGITGGLTDVNGAIVDLGGILDLKATKCLKKCPMQVANPDIKCITPTMYPEKMDT
ncbi:hypothetical protein Bhyg_14399 [Pseudolycoriella hygida]|uniref:Uncharacterized protein n=1 Tax=Pseudolycoriella hygida TaxID=35572 RepID=A0A9Q0RXE2_9DIPT|nr:hypothetical protein Bhyg_14399 [Pseudolycoriella hygida]